MNARFFPHTSGPWVGEPDEHYWIDEKSGLACAIIRNEFGAWCGYVGVGREHPWFGRDYNALGDIEIHGGLTFSGDADWLMPPGLFWFGFDCAHCFDFIPYLPGGRRGTYRDFQYVTSETAKLAAQIAVPAKARSN